MVPIIPHGLRCRMSNCIIIHTYTYMAFELNIFDPGVGVILHIPREPVIYEARSNHLN